MVPPKIINRDFTRICQISWAVFAVLLSAPMSSWAACPSDAPTRDTISIFPETLPGPLLNIGDILEAAKMLEESPPPKTDIKIKSFEVGESNIPKPVSSRVIQIVSSLIQFSGIQGSDGVAGDLTVGRRVHFHGFVKRDASRNTTWIHHNNDVIFLKWKPGPRHDIGLIHRASLRILSRDTKWDIAQSMGFGVEWSHTPLGKFELISDIIVGPDFVFLPQFGIGPSVFTDFGIRL